MKKLCLSIAIAVALLMTFIAQGLSEIGLGLSVYRPNVTVTVGKQTTFAVGRVYNVGSNTIYVTSTISTNLSLTVLQPNVTLAAGDSFEVEVLASNLTSDMLGTYVGAVEVTGHGLEPVSGSPVLPGGTLPFNITVIRGLLATFSVFQMMMKPFEFSSTETSNASVSVANTGDEEGVYALVLKLDGEVYARQNLTIAAGENVTVAFPITASAGQHQLTVEDLRLNFTVVPDNSRVIADLALIGGGIVGSIAIIVAYKVLVRRNRKVKVQLVETR